MHRSSVLPRTAFLSLALAALLGACGDSTAPDNGPAEVIVTGVDTLRYLGGTSTMTAVVRNANHETLTGVAVGWESSNPVAVTVDATTGLVTAVKNGVATITARVGGVRGSAIVVAQQIPASVTITQSVDTLRAIGADAQYLATVKDSGGSTIVNPSLVWSSTNPAVVLIDGVQGLARAVSNGSAYVQARAATAVDSVPLAVRQQIDPSKSRISVARPFLFVDDAAGVTLEGRDLLGNRMAFGGSTVGFSSIPTASGGTSTGTFGPTVDRGDGTYTSDFTGTGIGTPRVPTAAIDGTPVSTVVAIPEELRVVGFTKIAAYSAGFTMTCGMITTGDLYCWGEQNGGARGTGVLNEPNSAPTIVSGGHKWIDFDVGAAGGCGIDEFGKLLCWGDAGQGSLGNGATSGRYPSPVVALPDEFFASLDLGLSNGGCAVGGGFAALCWSSGTWGRLGNGADTLVAVPVTVSGGHQFFAVATSYSGSCGVTHALTVMCWGYSQYLGIGSGPFPDTCAGPVPCAKTPVEVSGGITFKPIIVHGGNEVCAIGTNDKTYCWGMFDNVPTELFGAPVFTSLATGDMDNCGVAQNGTAYCWGTNRNGRFGNPPNINELHRVPEPVPGGQHFTQLSMGQTHMCGVATDGNAWCWGSNAKGELGDRTTTPSTTPMKVRLFAP
ncbi:MAG: Ig-like domain-containing protein [Gemmatimonadota bacterium]|nr:Ig-like domain-containing protein [Gemmatimonadota bacterium]